MRIVELATLGALAWVAGCAPVEKPALLPEDSGCAVQVWVRDLDGDGWGDASRGTSSACDAPAGYVAEDGDCDDTDSTAHPGAPEVCDWADQDCDGEVDEDATDAAIWHPDLDGDGYGDSTAEIRACAAGSGRVANAEDCDDTSADIHPEVAEVCDGLDQDCDGDVDEDAADAPAWYGDADGDGYGDFSARVDACEAPAGTVEDPTDCDDGDPDIHPYAPEYCDGVDQDCDYFVDDRAVDAPTWYADADGDGFGDPGASESDCVTPDGHVSAGTDCDDTNPDISPDAPETCASPADDDCDGAVDEGSAIDAPSWYADLDGDGHGDAYNSLAACALPAGYTSSPTDCDDTDAGISPDASELCASPADDDCDGAVDESDAADAPAWYADLDLDGYGNPAVSTTACEQPLLMVANDSDCDDTDAAISPAGTETCASPADDDCDGEIDEDDAVDALPWHPDADIDGRGDSFSVAYACTRPSGYTEDDTDCDDTDPAAHPGALEDCTNPGDEDCDGDDNDLRASGCARFYTDGDGDGYGVGTPVCQCYAAAPYAAAAPGDCDDSDATANPDASEVWGSGVDEDCDGYADVERVSDAGTLWYGTANGERAGQTLLSLGDADGDGVQDAAVAAPYRLISGVAGGAVYVLDGPLDRGGRLETARLILTAEATGDLLGWAMATGEDLDGDGAAELVVGAPNVSAGFVLNGTVYLFEAPLSGNLSTADAYASLIGHGEDDHLGSVVMNAGDTDGDGLPDLLLGASAWTEGTLQTGAACLVTTLPSGGVTTLGSECLYGETDGEHAGRALGAPGDVDGDGYDDLLIGAPGWASWAGRAYLVLSPPSARDLASADAVFGFTYDETWAGFAVAGTGDQDGDALPDLAITAPYDGTWVYQGGSVFLVSGTTRGAYDLGDSRRRLIGARGELFGDSVLPLDDLDGDGVGELLLGNVERALGGVPVGGVWTVTGG